jgi:hypothetical protein
MRRFAWLLLLPVSLASAAGPSLEELLLPGATFVLGIKLKHILASPAAQQMLVQARASRPELAQLAQAMPFDPLEVVDEVVISSAGAGKDAPSLVALRGRFGALRGLPGETYHGVALLAAGSTKTARLALLDDSLALIGELPVVQAAIDRRGHPAQLPAGMPEKAAALALRYDIYGFGRIPAAAMPPQGAKGAAVDVARAVDQFQFGMTMSHGLELSADLRTRADHDARNLMQQLRTFTAMMPPPQPGGAAATSDLDVRKEGNWVHLSLRVPETAAQRAAGARAAATAAAARTPSRVPPGAALVITGSEADGGVIVIPK